MSDTHRMTDDEVMEAAQVLWDYHRLDDELRPTDAAIGLGSHDIGVAEWTAELYHRELFPLVVFTGANAPTTVEVFPRGEAVHFAERAEQLGVPASAILCETAATNTGENFRLTRALLDREGRHVRSATIVCRPYQQRRAFATCKKVWPELDLVCTARPQSLADYVETIGDRDRVVNMLVGDTQRIWLYEARGYAHYQVVTPPVMTAYSSLVAAGFVSRVVDPARPEGP